MDIQRVRRLLIVFYALSFVACGIRCMGIRRPAGEMGFERVWVDPYGQCLPCIPFT